jgi:hypothetical protein
MSKIIQMYRPSQYSNWAEAERSGGVYGVEVPQDTPDEAIRQLIHATSNCMSGNDPVVWRYKPAKLTALQEAFVRAYRENVGVATSEQVDEFVRKPSNCPTGMMDCEWHTLHEAYDMFMAGRVSYAAGL